MNDSRNDLKRLRQKRKSGQESFHANGTVLPIILQDFWSWSASDLVGNALRGLVAEYLVSEAVGAGSDVRVEWDAYDVLSSENVKIEVKSAAYVQSWDQREYSKISFDISPSRGWDARTNEYSSTPMRQADIYVFCLLHHKDKATVDPLNVAQWTFYVLPVQLLNEKLGNQKRLSLNPLLVLEPLTTNYEELPEAIASVL